MSDEQHHDDEIHHHISPLSTYISVFAALMVFTFITVWIAGKDLGLANTFVAVTIAVIKATIVVLWFMHLKYSAKITWVAAGAGFIWLAVMIALTMSDVASRDWIPFPDTWL